MRYPATCLALCLWLGASATAEMASTRPAEPEPAPASAEAGPAGDQPARVPDTRLVKAAELVMGSPRYLHHAKLRRGMTGHGLTVLEGTRIVRFDVEILSVMSTSAMGGMPQQDVILARVKGQQLELTGIVRGMSGSPVYVNDASGDRLIGALAYGFPNQRIMPGGQVCGIQPIVQMLAAAGLPTEQQDQPPTIVAETPPGGMLASAASDQWKHRQWLEQALTSEKIDFVSFGLPPTPRTPADGQASEAALEPLATPVMVSGLGGPAREQLARAWAPRGLMPVQAGGVGHVPDEQLKGLALAPGAALAVPMVTGDADVTAVGTVTEVVGNRVLGFGHALNGSGQISYPLATGYVHAVVPRQDVSFKLGAAVRTVGELVADESSAVAGVLGQQADMVPMEIDVTWSDTRQRQCFRYHVIHDRDNTAMLVAVTAVDSLLGQRNLPTEYTLEYEVTIGFDNLGTYHTANLSTATSLGEFLSDLIRPIAVMHRNPYGIARLTSIKASVRVDRKTNLAQVLGVRPDRNRYYPGEEVTATVTLRRYLGERFTRQVRLKLDANLPPDRYTLKVGGADLAMEADRRRQPRAFQPQNLADLLAALNLIAARRSDQLVAVVNLPGQDTAVEQDVLAGTPPSVAAMLRAARPLDVSAAGKVLINEHPQAAAIFGAAQAELVVEAPPAMP